MPVKLGTKDLFPYLGDYRPVNIYKGENKIAGWKGAEQSGEELYFENTYNDFVDAEIDGKSFQHAGSGKNLFDIRHSTYNSTITPNEWGGFDRSGGFGDIRILDIKVEPNQTYTFSYKIEYGSARQEIYDGDGSVLYALGTGRDVSFTPKHSTIRINMSNARGDNDLDSRITEIQLEEGSTATAYEPPVPTPDYPIEIHSLNNFDVVSSTEKLSEGQLEEYDYGAEYENIYKINLLLSEPLRSVGDVKDRLFRDSDGLWKVERNVEPIHPEDGSRTIEETYDVLDSPVYEVLPQDYQDKLNNLRSFQDSNYIYTVINNKTDIISENLKPMIHAKLKEKDI